MKAREMIASFIDGNAGRLNDWLDEVYEPGRPTGGVQLLF
jgi:hypothetical protein